MFRKIIMVCALGVLTSLYLSAQKMTITGKFENGYSAGQKICLAQNPYFLSYECVAQDSVNGDQEFRATVQIRTSPLIKLITVYDLESAADAEPVRWFWLGEGEASLSLYEVANYRHHVYYRGPFQAENEFLEYYSRQMNRIYFLFAALESSDNLSQRILYYFDQLDSIQTDLAATLNRYALDFKIAPEFRNFMEREIAYLADRFKLACMQHQYNYSGYASRSEDSLMVGLDVPAELNRIYERIGSASPGTITAENYRHLVNEFFYLHYMKNQPYQQEADSIYLGNFEHDSVIYEVIYRNVVDLFRDRPVEREFVLANMINRELGHVRAAYSAGYTVKGCEKLLSMFRNDFPQSEHYQKLKLKALEAHRFVAEHLQDLMNDTTGINSLGYDSLSGAAHLVQQYPVENEAAPPFTLTDSKGKPVSSKDYFGKMVYVSAWNSSAADICSTRQRICYVKFLEEKLRSKKVIFLYVELAGQDEWPTVEDGTVKEVMKTMKCKGKYLEARGAMGAKFKQDYGLGEYETSFWIDEMGNYHSADYGCDADLVGMDGLNGQ